MAGHAERESHKGEEEMLKSFLNWLLEKVPVSNWVVIIWLFGMAVVGAFELRRFFEKVSEK